MTVLITGGSGFVGSWVTRELLGRGEQVVLYDLYPRTDLIYDLLDEVTLVKGDLLDFGNLADATTVAEAPSAPAHLPTLSSCTSDAIGGPYSLRVQSVDVR